MSSSGELDWKFGQVFGDKTTVEDVADGMFPLPPPFLSVKKPFSFCNPHLCQPPKKSKEKFLPPFPFSFSLSRLIFFSPGTVDIVSAIEFDQTGDYLAAGDRGGRVVLFEREKSKDKGTHFKFFYEFQSHDPEFDYLKSRLSFSSLFFLFLFLFLFSLFFFDLHTNSPFLSHFFIQLKLKKKSTKFAGSLVVPPHTFC